jgi:hypothetical protein
MIPKIIHCVWLSGDEKPAIYKKCISSWIKYMPDFEIKEWSLNNLPNNLLNHTWVKSAIAEKKWAYATDFIRLWAVYEYGGIYLDMDVQVYKSFEPFLQHRAFSCLEIFPEKMFATINKKETIGLGIEAAVLGCERGHSWLADVMEYYNDKTFINDYKFQFDQIMPRVLQRVSIEKYGFKLVPLEQELKGGIHIYPAEVFSYIPDFNLLMLERNTDAIDSLGDNIIRYSFHHCAHGWWEGDPQYKTKWWKLKHFFWQIFHMSTIKR